MMSLHTKGNGRHLSSCFMLFSQIEIYLRKRLLKAIVKQGDFVLVCVCLP